eukprot:3591308-Alexandrium_andersonii.AAC.1
MLCTSRPDAFCGRPTDGSNERAPVLNPKTPPIEPPIEHENRDWGRSLKRGRVCIDLECCLLYTSPSPRD